MKYNYKEDLKLWLPGSGHRGYFNLASRSLNDDDDTGRFQLWRNPLRRYYRSMLKWAQKHATSSRKHKIYLVQDVTEESGMRTCEGMQASVLDHRRKNVRGQSGIWNTSGKQQPRLSDVYSCCGSGRALWWRDGSNRHYSRVDLTTILEHCENLTLLSKIVTK